MKTIYICRLGIIHLDNKCNCEHHRDVNQPYELSPALLTARPGTHFVELRTEQDGTLKLYKK